MNIECLKIIARVGMVSLLTLQLYGQVQPTVINASSASAPNGIAPNGIGATTGELLFSQPFCMTAGQPRGIYSVTNLTGTGSPLTATVTDAIPLPTDGCAENYFFIAPGGGGFTAGDVYSTVPTGSTTDAVYKNGSLFVGNIADSSPGHAGITFDTVGTFGQALIVTTASAVYGFNAVGAQLFSYPTPSGFLLESATVAPISNASCPGCLYLTTEAISAANGGSGPDGMIYIIRPGTPSGTAPTPVATAPGVEPEGILFITPQTCTLNGTDFSYFVSAYASGTQRQTSPSSTGSLLAYTQSQISPLAGQALIPFEREGAIDVFNPATNQFTSFSTPTPIPTADPPFYQLEGAALVACSPATGCPATQGFWKHHAFPGAMFTNGTVTIGGVQYTAAQLVNILNTPPKGGDAALILMHQLIAALANEAAGAQNVGVIEQGVNVNLAIAQAEALLQFGLPQPGFPGSNPPGTSFPINFNATSGNTVQASTTLGTDFTTLSNVLDAYNSAVGLNCQEGAGLNP